MLKVGDRAPNLKVSDWVQGEPTNIDKEIGKVVLVEVFQVNCPGAIFYGMKKATEIYKKFDRKDVTVLGFATAFEDYGLNNLENLKAMLYDGKVVGDTKEKLGAWGGLENGRLKQKIPFPIARDSLTNPPAVYSSFYNMGEYAETFNEYGIHGTPSSIIIDRKGVLREITFGSGYDQMKAVKALVKEK